MIRRVIALWLVALMSVSAGFAQEAAEPAVLIADRVSVTPDGKLIAEGNVEAFQGSQKISAQRITYDQSTETLSIEGPIRLTDGGVVTILADSAELDRGLQNGLLQGARMVLDQNVQLAALELRRTGGRYSELYTTAVTSCRVCAEGDAPLWQIRARRVIHDQLERQLYFEDAQLRIYDVPVFYVPRLRLPDPTLDRATGFLIPEIRSTSQLSNGVKLPYFFRLNETSDLTIEPYLSSKTRTLGLAYRRAFANGRIAFEGAYTDDDLRPESRGYVFGAGAFSLPNRYELSFDIEWVSDNAYINDYGLPDQDRLATQIALTRTDRNTFTGAALIHYQSLRDGEDESLLPTLVFDIAHERRYAPNLIGGEARFSFLGHTHHRTSDLDVLGRDVARATVDASWRRDWIFASGLRTDWQVGLAADMFDIQQDSNYPGLRTRITPRSAVTFRMPLTRANGATTHFLEPIVQLGWSNVSGDDVPDDESGFAEFDQGNLLKLSRFPAPDVREDGAQLAYGVNYARFGETWQAHLTVGQIIRSKAQPDFTETSGLSGDVSDILLAGQIRTGFGLDLTARTIFNDAFDVAKAEVRGDWRRDYLSFVGSYLWLQADAAEGRTDDLSEIYFDGAYDINPNWTASAIWRYDIADARASRAGLGLTYRNECVEVDLSLNRRFDTSTTVEPTTSLGLSVALRGFTVNNGTERYVRSCNS